ncbi:tetratricopeptide repeat protein [Candidatus Poribacteria bacterium]|nr:tetratricopeptide repeat protein [Candidatus Poribacteria bacterium]
MHDDRNQPKRPAEIDRSRSDLSERHPNLVQDILARGRRELAKSSKAAESFGQGLAALNEKRYADALRAFNAAGEADPEAGNVRYYTGLTRFMLGQYSAAVSEYSAAIDRGYAEPDVVQSLGDALFLLECYSEAAEAYSAAISVRPSADAYTRMGNALSMAGERDRAVAAFKEALLLKLVSVTAGDVEPMDERGDETLNRPDGTPPRRR